MELLTSLALVVARFGSKKVLAALYGDDFAGLSDQLISVMTGMEKSQSRLVEIERKIDVLLDKDYVDNQARGTRLLCQAFLEGRSAARREDDLREADRALLVAAHAANTALQRSQSERALCLVRIAQRDLSGAHDAWRSLDVAAGSAVNHAWTESDSPYGTARMLIERGDLGQGSMLDRLKRQVDVDERWHRAVALAEDGARRTLGELHMILNDVVSLGEVLGYRQPPFSYGTVFQSLTAYGALLMPPDERVLWAGRGCPVVALPFATRGSLGGISCTLLGARSESPDSSGYVDWVLSAEVGLSMERPEAVVVWVEVAPQRADQGVRAPASQTDREMLSPGQTLVIQRRIYGHRDHGPMRICAGVGGLAFVGPTQAATA